MAIFKTLKDLQDKTAKPVQAEGDRVPRYFSVKPGEEFRIRFRQELSEDLTGYNEEVGLAEHIMVHTNPGDFRKSAACTGHLEEFGYKCWACEQVPSDRGWKAKGHLLINIAVLTKDDDGNDVWVPRVLDHKFTPAHVAENLVEYAMEYETIIDRDYKIKRKGQKQETQYTLVPMGVKDADESIKDLTYHDLTKMYKNITPAEQPGFYLATEDTSSGAKGWD